MLRCAEISHLLKETDMIDIPSLKRSWVYIYIIIIYIFKIYILITIHKYMHRGYLRQLCQHHAHSGTAASSFGLK